MDGHAPATTRATHTPAAKYSCCAAWFAVVTLAVLATVEARQYDALAALSAIPPWAWWLGAALVAAIALLRCPSRTRLAVIAILLLVGLNSIEQCASLGRSLLDIASPAPPRTWLRVVSLNCSAGSRRAAAEVAACDPDVAFLQESPGEDGLKELAAGMFGAQAGILATRDCSIIARGQLELVREGDHYLHATLHRADGRVLQVICVRLLPPVVRYDLWSPSCWREHREARQQRRAQAREVARSLGESAPGDLIVLAGDCNAPAGDGALQEWSSVLQDAFASSGRGWGATVLNRIPVHRFDQVWSSQAMTPQRVAAVRSGSSDHRLVVADFSTPPETERSPGRGTANP